MMQDDNYYLMDRPEPTEEFLHARWVALFRLQSQFDLKRGSSENEQEDFHYLRTELTCPTFDHISFSYKNKVFSVFIDLVDDGLNSITPRRRVKNLVNVARDNNLVPCLFKLRISDMKPVSDGWNLFHAVTKKPVVPELIAGNEPTAISEWEYCNWAVRVVLDYFDNDTGKISSFCDAPGILPQIWFENNNNEKCWILVKHAIYPNIAEMDEDFVPPSVILGFKGYFAGVSFCYADERHPDKQLFRNSPVYLRYKGLQEVWNGKVDLKESILWQ